MKAMHDLEMRRYSVLASWIIQPHVKKKIKPTDLYNPDKDNQKASTTPEESQRVVDELAMEMGVD